MVSDFVETERGSVVCNGKEYFPASKIAEILKVSRTAIYKRAAKEKWLDIRIPGKGARDGVRYYLVPMRMLEETTSSNKSVDSMHYAHTPYPALINSSTDNEVKNFITLPKYALQSMPDRVIHSDQVVDHLAFNKEWLEMSLNVTNNRLALIQVKGDSMEPTLKSDDLILTDISQSHIGDDSIYVLQLQNDLVLKRIQRKINGSVIIKSDNPIYGEEILDESAAQSLPVVGRVIWYGRRL